MLLEETRSLQELRQRANVEISQDLSESRPQHECGAVWSLEYAFFHFRGFLVGLPAECGAEELSLDGFRSFCLAARESVTLRRLRMEAAFLEKFAGTIDSAAVENALRDLFRNRQLLSVELDKVPAAFQEFVAFLIRIHPRLEEGPEARGLRELPAGIRFFLQGEAAEPGCPLAELRAVSVNGKNSLDIATEFGAARAVQALLSEVFSGGSGSQAARAQALRTAAYEGQAPCVEVLLVAKFRRQRDQCADRCFPAAAGSTEWPRLLRGAAPESRGRYCTGEFAERLFPAADGSTEWPRLLRGAAPESGSRGCTGEFAERLFPVADGSTEWRCLLRGAAPESRSRGCTGGSAGRPFPARRPHAAGVRSGASSYVFVVQSAFAVVVLL